MTDDTPILTCTKDGPLKLTNVDSVVLSDGSQGAAKTTMFLCRCGHSANKPFCDGTHKKVGWTE